MLCDKSTWQMFQCGHSFHVECNLPAVSECQVCKAHLIKQIGELSAKANTAVSNRATDEEADHEDPQQEHQDEENDIELESVEDGGEVGVQSLIKLIKEISSWTCPSPPAW